MRVLIVSYAFPPYNSIGGVRVGKTARYLLKSGHDVRVIAARDQPYPPNLPLEIPERNVIYAKWINIRKPAEIVWRHVCATREDSPIIPRRSGFRQAFQRGVKFGLRRFLDFPDATIGWFPYAVREATNLLKNWRPDIILASAPPYSTLLVARRLARKHRVPWVADLRDLWVDHQYYDQPGWREWVERRLERSVLSSATGLITVSEPLAATLRTKYGREPCIVLNGFDPPDYPAQAGQVPLRRGSVRILYTGCLYEGKQDPSPLFSAIRELGAEMPNLEVAFYGPHLDKVRELIARYGAESIVKANSPVPYRESLRMQSEADILLLVLWNDPHHKGVYTGKLFEYLGARRPILAVGAPGDVAAQLIESRGLGVVTKDAHQILNQLNLWIKQKQQMGFIPSPCKQGIAQFSREEQTRVLEKYLSELIE